MSPGKKERSGHIHRRKSHFKLQTCSSEVVTRVTKFGTLLMWLHPVDRSFEKGLDEDFGESLRSGKGLSGRENILRLVLKQHEDEYTDLRTFT